MRFIDLNLSEPILRAVSHEGYTTATPIQAQTIPFTLEGRDVLGCAQTGTGKTAAFALPILQRLSEASMANKGPRGARCLVLAPTRELASQIADSFRTYGKHLNLQHAIVYGGVSQNPQVQALRRGVDIIVATPGRLLDLMNQGHVDLKHVATLVLDEADRMLDMGFMPDIERIMTKLPQQRQTLLFSATMPPDIRRLADKILRNPAKVQIAVEPANAVKIEQSVYHIDRTKKPVLLAHLIDTLSIERAIVFTRTKHGADRVARNLRRTGTRVEAIHGDKSQNARSKALDGFKKGKLLVLVATDIASRGIDVDGVSHVFNYDMSRDPESHVHRIGRTARAGASGMAISFCDPEERPLLKAIERLTRSDIPVVRDVPQLSLPTPVALVVKTAKDGRHPTRENTASTNQQPWRSGKPANAPAGKRRRPRRRRKQVIA